MRMGSGTTISPSANFAPPPANSDVTLGPGPAGAGAFFPPAQAVTVDKTGKPVQAPTAKKPSKPMPFESLFGIGLLSIAGLAAVIAGGWFWYAHRKPPEPPPHQVVTIPTPGPEQSPPQTPPQTQPSGPTTPIPPPGPDTNPTKPGPEATPTKPVPASGPSTLPANSPKSTKPSAGKPASAKTTPAPPQPVAVVTPPSAPCGQARCARQPNTNQAPNAHCLSRIRSPQGRPK